MNAKEEILEALENLRNMDRVLKNVHTIREILSRYELVQIDDTPFDPERCGYEFDDFQNFWQKGDDLIFGQPGGEISFEHRTQDYHVPLSHWPTHSAGVSLLKGLGIDFEFESTGVQKIDPFNRATRRELIIVWIFRALAFLSGFALVMWAKQ